MYLLEVDSYIVGIVSHECDEGICHPVDDDNEFYIFLKNYHPYTRVKVDSDGVMSYVNDESRKTIQERTKFKKDRDSFISTSTVTYEGMVFDSDEVSQNRMLRPIAILQNDTDTHLWVLHDNTVVQLNKPQFLAVLELAGQQQTNVWVQP